jgi:hypothetical protein
MDFINLFINLLQLFGVKKDWCGRLSIILQGEHWLHSCFPAWAKLQNL